MPFSQAFGYDLTLGVLACGGLVILPSPADDFVGLANALGVTITGATPPMLRALLDLDPSPTRRLETVDSLDVMGAHLSDRLARDALHLTPNILLGFGTTEAGRIAVGSAALSLTDPTAVGFVLPWVDAEIVDAADRRLPAGEQGILRVRTEQMIAGYWRDDAATRLNFRNGWFYPGDLGSIDATGLLRVTGRTADVIVRDGAMLSPIPIEAEIRGVAGVRDVAVFPLVQPDGVQAVCAALVLANRADEPAVRAALVRQLGARAPDHVFLIEALPRNAAGKVVRGELVNWAVRHAPAGMRAS
jgi:acyl-CoA synthetase (AMP-forming)/AMP-acid ligase II